VRIIKEPTLRGYWQRHPDAEAGLAHWIAVTRPARWRSIDDVRRDFPHADAATVASGHTVTVFNVAGNKYRLVVSIKYRFGVVYVRDFLTHVQYSRGAWKERH
jgi:mRNA interferase HigB